MVGLVEGMVYAYKVGLIVEIFIKVMYTSQIGLRYLDFYVNGAFTKYFDHKFSINHFVKNC